MVLSRSFLFAMALLACGVAVHAQKAVTDADPSGLQMSRADLTAMLARFESTLATTTSSSQRERIVAEAALVRERLDQGDYRVGDQITMVVEGFTELSDTFQIGSGRILLLPTIGEIPMAGILRSELQSHIATYVARFIREPRVHARSLLRLYITGAVARPGFYNFPSDLLLSQVLMQAGLNTTARLNGTRIKRGSETVWKGEPIEQALVQGWTLDQLSIRAGDNIDVPTKASPLATARNILIALSTAASFVYFAKQIGVF